MKPVIEFRSDQEGVKPIYACGNCKTLAAMLNKATREGAEKCCLCVRCELVAKDRYYSLCESCREIEQAERDEKERQRRLSKPVVPYECGMVWSETFGRFFDDLDDLGEYVYDNEIDPVTVIAHPCIDSKLPVPSIRDYVEEQWMEEYDEPEHGELTKAAETILDRAATELAEHAPTVWHPRTDIRIAVPALNSTGLEGEQS